MELQLVAPEGNNKENAGPLAKVSILAICSQPVDDLEGDRKAKQGIIQYYYPSHFKLVVKSRRI